MKFELKQAVADIKDSRKKLQEKNMRWRKMPFMLSLFLRTGGKLLVAITFLAAKCRRQLAGRCRTGTYWENIEWPAEWLEG